MLFKQKQVVVLQGLYLKYFFASVCATSFVLTEMHVMVYLLVGSSKVPWLIISLRVDDIFFFLLRQGDAPLSSCSLQQLLEESRQVVTTGSEHRRSTPHCSVLPTVTRGTPDNLCSPKCKTSHQRPPALTLKV